MVAVVSTSNRLLRALGQNHAWRGPQNNLTCSTMAYTDTHTEDLVISQRVGRCLTRPDENLTPSEVAMYFLSIIPNKKFLMKTAFRNRLLGFCWICSFILKDRCMHLMQLNGNLGAGRRRKQ